MANKIIRQIIDMSRFEIQARGFPFRLAMKFSFAAGSRTATKT